MPNTDVLLVPRPRLTVVATIMADKLARVPSEIFSLKRLDPKPSGLGPRLGTIALKGRAPLPTPHYLALSSRGAVPHLSQDVMRKHTDIKAVHVALEDCKSMSGRSFQALVLTCLLRLEPVSHRESTQRDSSHICPSKYLNPLVTS